MDAVTTILTMLFLLQDLGRRMARNIGWSRTVGERAGVSRDISDWNEVPISVE
jgi:hypothetical protein